MSSLIFNQSVIVYQIKKSIHLVDIVSENCNTNAGRIPDNKRTELRTWIVSLRLAFKTYLLNIDSLTQCPSMLSSGILRNKE
jgi:hypothetical protein